MSLRACRVARRTARMFLPFGLPCRCKRSRHLFTLTDRQSDQDVHARRRNPDCVSCHSSPILRHARRTVAAARSRRSPPRRAWPACAAPRDRQAARIGPHLIAPGGARSDAASRRGRLRNVSKSCPPGRGTSSQRSWPPAAMSPWAARMELFRSDLMYEDFASQTR